MPKVGERQFAYTPEGIAEAESYSDATGLPMSNAMERSVQTYLGGGRVTNPTVGYKKGGKVKKK
jgi:hypothetical protein